MDAQTQDTSLVSEKEQLSAPPGWTKKLVPASAKSITLRKYDVIFIAPDGQELKSKWHLTRYLKAHPESPAISEFSWNTGEEAPIRRSSRFATKETSEGHKSTSRRKGKRDAAEMEDDQEKAPSRKRAKKGGKSDVSSEKQAAEKVEGDVLEKDEVMHEAVACDTEAHIEAAQGDAVQGKKSKDANLGEVVIEKAEGEELAKAENSIAEQEDIQATDEGLETLVVEETINVSSANIVGEHEEIQVTVVEVTKSISDNGGNTEYKAAQESGSLIAPVEDSKVEGAAMETTGIGSEELPDQKLAENEGDVSCKVTVVTSVTEAFSEEEPLGPLMQQAEEPSEVALTQKENLVEPVSQKEGLVEPLTQKEDPVEPLMQKEEPERPTHIQNSPQHIKDRSPNEFSSSPVPLGVANHQ